MISSCYFFLSVYQPQFSSTPSLPQTGTVHQGGVPTAQAPPPSRQVLSSLASQENVKQHQVLFRGPIKKTAIPVPSPLSAHSLSANGSATPTSSPGEYAK